MYHGGAAGRLLPCFSMDGGPVDHEAEAALGSYGDAVDMAVKVPTLSGVLVAFVLVSAAWAWRHLRGRAHQ